MGRPFAFSQSVDTPVSGYRNAIMNGNFGIWQRGTVPNTISLYSNVADRWIYYRGTGATATVQRENLLPGEDFGNGLNPPYRIHISSNNLASVTPQLYQMIEDVRTFENRTATLSGWIHSENATISMTPSIGQYFGSGGSANVYTNGTAVTCTSNTWIRIEQTFSVPSIVGKTVGAGSSLGVIFTFPTSTAYVVRLQCLQLEAGSAATPFEERPAAIELALCQRYFEKNYDQDVAIGTAGGAGFYGYIEYGIGAGSGHPAFWPFKVPKRITPSMAAYADDSTYGQGTFGGAGNVSITLSAGPNAMRYFVTAGGAPTISAGSWQDFYWVANADF